MCLAQCELNAGNSPKAIEYGEAARAIIEKRDNKERYIDVLSILGDAYSNISQYNKALSFLKEAQSIEENKSHRYFSRNRFYIFQKLGMVSLRMGDFSESDTYYRVAHEIAKALFEEDNFEYGTFLYSLAQKDYILGRIDEAKEEVKKAKEIFLNKMGENTPFANNAEVLEAFIGIADGDISTSIYKLEKSCLNLEKQGSPITESLFMLLKAYCAGGEYKKAISTGEKLLTVLKPNGKELINHANTYLDMAVAYYNLNNADKYADYTAKAINIYKDKIQNNFLLMTKKERANIWNSSSYLFLTGLPLACHRLADHEKLSSILYDATLFGKGLLLQADNNITDIINTSGDEELSYEYSTLLSLSAEQKRLSTLFAEQTDEDMKLTLVSEMDSLYEDIDRREHHIMEHISDVAGKYTRKLSATWTDIKRALHKGEIAVEFEQAQYAPDSIFYYALVVTPDSKVPSYIPLTWQRDISARLPFATSTDADRKELTKAIWSPIIAAIPDIKKIYFSPVGELYDIPIESLPTLSEQDILMSKLYQVHRLSSTREIIADNNRTNTAKGMAIYGGLNYDTSVEELKEDAKKYNTTGQRGSDYLSFTDERGAEQELEPLPGTEVEAQSIIALINDDFTNRINVTPYLGSRGTEASFRALSGKDTRILHLGTHGFYYPQTAVNNSTRMQSLFHLYDDVNINSVSTETEEDKALSRCGLYLTGAQNRLFGEKMDGTDDGILTAREISSLHLENVDLAVLSACETGTGDITGEGVFGLQRGFKKAGTKAILMSLWKVNDESTSVLMTEFYRNWLQTGNMQDALEKAKSYVRSQKEEWKSPYYWAPFVLLDAVE
jgi:CHAT domain-containing protein/tetratricopeptide (TPR) repeat protein